MKQIRFSFSILVVLLISQLGLSQTQATKTSPRRSSASPVPEMGLALRDGWSLQSSCKVDKPGEIISSSKFAPTGWYTVSVPSTVVAALVQQKVYPNPDFGMNLRKLPGMDYPIGANFSNIPMQQDSPFMVPWRFRKVFTLPESYKSKSIWLDFGGINYRANIFLNGKQIAKKEDIAGAWRTYELNISDAAQPGKSNVLAVEIFS